MRLDISPASCPTCPKMVTGKTQEPMNPDPQSNEVPERQLRNWERIAWVIGLVAGIQAAYTTWMSGFQYMNARRDLILGIGQPKCLAPDLAFLIFKNDWLTCATGFFLYAACAFGVLWLLLARYRPVQDALLNPFGVPVNDGALNRRRRILSLAVGVFVVGILIALAATLIIDGADTWGLMKAQHC